MSAIGAIRRATGGHRHSRLAAAGVALTVLLGCIGFAVGHGNTSLTVSTPPGNAWLANNSRGSVTLVNGSTGRASAEILLSGSAGHALQITQDGSTILVRDPVTGVLTRIDPNQLTLGASATTPTGSIVVGSSAATYLVDFGSGALTLQRVDPVTLSAIGRPVQLTGAFGQPVVDGSGTLWLPDPAAGTVIPITDTGQGTPVRVGGPGADIVLTTAGGNPIAVDTTGRRVTEIAADGSEDVVALPASAGGQTLPLLVPATGSSGSVPLLSQGSAPSLVLVNLTSATTQTIPLGTNVAGDNLGAPVEGGGRIFVPDYTTGTALVYDATSGQPASQITVTGHSGVFQTQVLDGIVYFNDPSGDNAVVVTPDGQVHDVAKSGPGVPASNGQPPVADPPQLIPPGATPSSAQNPSAPSGPGTQANGPSPHKTAPQTTPTGSSATVPQLPPASQAPSVPAVAPVSAGPVPSATIPVAPVTSLPASSLPAVPVAPVTSAPPVSVPPVGALPSPPVSSSPASSPPVTQPTPTPSKSQTPPPTPTPSATATLPATPTPTPTPTVTAPPLAPTGVQVANGAGYVDVSWNAATSGGPVASYGVSLSPQGGTQTNTGATSVRITGLSCSNIYTVTVTATGPGGSVAAAPVRTRQCTAPSAPRNVSVSASGVSALVVSWSAPSNNGGDGAVSYKVTGPNGTTTTSSTSFTQSGLKPGHDSSFTVAAVNAAGSTGASAVSGTPGSTATGAINLQYFTTSQPPCTPPIATCTAGIHTTTSYSTSPIAWNALDGTTYTTYCQTTGESLRNDKLTASTRWLYIRESANGPWGWASAMWFTSTGTFGSGLPTCPSSV